MTEKKEKVEIVATLLHCDKCNGLMVKDDYVALCHPVKYTYKCEECEFIVITTIDYPYITYELIGEIK